MGKFGDRRMDKYERIEQDQLNDLKAWQDGSLINTDAINNLSLEQLEALNKMLEGVK